MKIETAIIPVAGAGSRVFPIGTAVEKCMLPVYAGNDPRPVVDYMVQDCAGAGIDRIVFVTTERGKTQLGDYYDNLTKVLETQLRTVGKNEKIAEDLERRRAVGIKLEYLIQPADRYGTAVPPTIAKDALRGESHFALMGGDDFVYHRDGTSELGLAAAKWSASGTDHVIMGLPVARKVAPKYGILDVDENGRLRGIDEKPPLDRVPQNPIANISRYLLSDKIWEQLDAEMALDRGTGEHYITYPIDAAIAAGQTFQAHAVTGTYLDCGSTEGLRDAGIYITGHPPTRHM